MSGRYWGCEMAGAEYDEKRGPNMGSRTTVRHGTQGVAASGGLAMLLQAMVDAGKMDIQHAFLALAILTPILTTAWKTWDQLGFTARLRGWLDSKGFKAAPIVAAMLIPIAGGCAVQLGTMEPKQFSTLGGGTLIACETKGILLAFGDADLCSNSARGGHVSRTFSDMTLGVVRTVGAAIAGFFGGAGQGMAQALESQPDPAPAVAAPSAPVAPDPAVSWESLGGNVTAEIRENPFTAPGE